MISGRISIRLKLEQRTQRCLSSLVRCLLLFTCISSLFMAVSFIIDRKIHMSVLNIEDEHYLNFFEHGRGPSTNSDVAAPSTSWLSEDTHSCLVQRQTNRFLNRKSLLTITLGARHAVFIDDLLDRFPTEDFDIIMFHWDVNEHEENLWLNGTQPRLDELPDWWFRPGLKHIYDRKKLKLDFARIYLTPDVVCEYEYVLLWDGDVRVTDSFSGSGLLDTMRSNHIDISQPAMTADSDGFWKFSRTSEKKIDLLRGYHEHWFVEIGFITFETSIWLHAQALLEKYPFRIYHFDQVPFKIVTPARKIAVIDSQLVVHNNRGIGAGSTLELNRSQIEADGELYRQVLYDANKITHRGLCGKLRSSEATLTSHAVFGQLFHHFCGIDLVQSEVKSEIGHLKVTTPFKEAGHSDDDSILYSTYISAQGLTQASPRQQTWEDPSCDVEMHWIPEVSAWKMKVLQCRFDLSRWRPKSFWRDWFTSLSVSALVSCKGTLSSCRMTYYSTGDFVDTRFMLVVPMMLFVLASFLGAVPIKFDFSEWCSCCLLAKCYRGRCCKNYSDLTDMEAEGDAVEDTCEIDSDSCSCNRSVGWANDVATYKVWLDNGSSKRRMSH